MHPAELRFYNTLTRQKEIFRSLKPGLVSLYSCGPTVYQAAHIGNLKTYLFVDILKRALEYDGFRVKHIMNITDVGHPTSDADTGEDKTEWARRNMLYFKCKDCGKTAPSYFAAERKSFEKIRYENNTVQCKFCGSNNTLSKKDLFYESPPVTTQEITKHNADLFKKDLVDLNIETPTKFAWASQYIKDQIKLIQQLEKNGYTYRIDDGIYFDTDKLSNYGKLSTPLIIHLSRIGVTKGKKSSVDFALWRFSKPEEKRQQEWPSPWGVGYPGWHVECSAISTKELGQPFDIHTGGEDHIAIHHNNEIAQSEAAYGKPLANYWLHSMFLLVNDAKMAKSEGNFITLPNLLDQGYYPLAFRYLVISSHYRNKLNFSKVAMDGAQNSLNKLRELFEKRALWGKVLEKYRKAFMLALGDDLNMPEVMKEVWTVVKSDESLADKQATVLDFDRVLGLNLKNYHPPVIPREIIDLANQREKAREAKDWAKSDELRQEIEAKGYQILDTDSGPILKPKFPSS